MSTLPKNREFFIKAAIQNAFSRLKTWFTEDPGQAKSAMERREASAMAQSGQTLKAGVAKMAQLRGYWEDSTFFTTSLAKQALSCVFDHVKEGDPVDIDSIFLEDFGKSASQLFQYWEPIPFAAASLGEVHNAKGFDLSNLAVKVQYKGIDIALRSDLEHPDLLEHLVGASMGGAVSAEAKQTLKQLLLSELDYQKEANSLLRFSKAFAKDAAFVFPVVNLPLSSSRILTLTKLQGEPLLGFLAHADEEQRNQVSINLFRYGYGSPIVHGLLNTDPNPGNFLVLDKNKLGLLDFGACIELSEDQSTYERVFWQALLAEDSEILRYTLYKMGVAKEAIEFDSDRYRAWEKLLALPFLTNHFQFTKAYAKELTQRTVDLVLGQRFTLPPSFLLLWRQRLGLIALLGRCHGEGNFRGLLLDMLRSVSMAPAGIH